jgi:isoquinoline 1-oxidoreductase beta subunit
VLYGDPGHWAQGWTDIPFDIRNLRVENGPAEAHVRIGWLRSVANVYHAFAVQCFADELAHLARRDPFDYLQDLIGPPRILDLNGADYSNYGASYTSYPIDLPDRHPPTPASIRARRRQIRWAKRNPGDGTGWGIAVHRSFVTYVATVVQVEVNARGELRIPRVDTAVDAGLVVDPVMVRTQFEGAAVFGTSVVRTGEITATNGVIDQSHD